MTSHRTRTTVAIILTFSWMIASLFVGTSPISASSSQPQFISTHFTSPSRNIDCQMFILAYTEAEGAPVNTIAECSVNNATWKNPPKRPADCDLDFEPFEVGLSSETTGSKVTNTVVAGACRGDVGPTCGPNECYALKYGASRTIGNVKCTSLKTGVMCVSTNGKRRGFLVSRAKFTIIG
jgi:hypothetical protein